MKIGIVLPYSIIKGGGVKEIVLAQQAELKKLGHDARIITPRPQAYDGEPDEDVIFVGGSTDFRSPTKTTVQISAGVNESIKEVLERENFDILHFHEPWIPMLSAQILTRSTAVNIATFHAKLPETVMSRTMAKVITPYTKPILKYIDYLTSPSEAGAEYVRSLTDKSISIIPNGIYVDDFKRPAKFNDARKKKTILYVGRLEGRKGVKYLLHAFKELSKRRPDVSLLIAGDGVDRAKLELLAADLELENVTFAGFISHEEKIKLLSTSDLFCSPALFGECFGIVLLEAMASGLVAVAGDNPGYASVMTGMGELSLVDPKHTREFARRLELLLYEPGLRQLWREWAAAETPGYNWDKVTEQYVNLYKRALREKSQNE